MITVAVFKVNAVGHWHNLDHPWEKMTWKNLKESWEANREGSSKGEADICCCSIRTSLVVIIIRISIVIMIMIIIFMILMTMMIIIIAMIIISFISIIISMQTGSFWAQLIRFFDWFHNPQPSLKFSSSIIKMIIWVAGPPLEGRLIRECG